MDIGILTAFLGGVLALLSPCGALLLPAFFAANLGRTRGLLLHGGIFYVGLAVTLVPLGLGVGALGQLLVDYRGVLIAGTSIVLILLGLLQAMGFGFDLSRILPGAQAAQNKAQQQSGIVKTLLLGATSGVAGFCAGPILGAILTLAMGTGSSLQAGAMLMVYGMGMVIPLLVLAAVWDKLNPSFMKKLRGKGFTLFGRKLHTTSVLTGLLIVVVGIVFWTTNGLVSTPSVVPAETQRWMQSYSGVLATPIWDTIFIVAVLLIIGGIWSYRAYKKQHVAQQSSDRTPENTV